MAIQVSGTEVISNARALTNIASVDATTVASLAAAGVGGGGSWQNIGSAMSLGTASNGYSSIGSITIPSAATDIKAFALFMDCSSISTTTETSHRFHIEMGPRTDWIVAKLRATSYGDTATYNNFKWMHAISMIKTPTNSTATQWGSHKINQSTTASNIFQYTDPQISYALGTSVGRSHSGSAEGNSAQVFNATYVSATGNIQPWTTESYSYGTCTVFAGQPLYFRVWAEYYDTLSGISIQLKGYI